MRLHLPLTAALAVAISLGVVAEAVAQPQLKVADDRKKALERLKANKQAAADKAAAEKAEKDKAAAGQEKAEEKKPEAAGSKGEEKKAEKAADKAEKKAEKAADKAEKKADKEGDEADDSDDEGKTPPGLEKKRKTRDDRRNARKKGLMKRWGDAVTMPEVKAELRRHARRIARLERIKEIAQEKKEGEAEEKVLERVDKLLTMETGRHERRMAELSKKEKGAGADESDKKDEKAEDKAEKKAEKAEDKAEKEEAK